MDYQKQKRHDNDQPDKVNGPVIEKVQIESFPLNFRDISLHNPNIKSGIIYRTATLTYYQNEDFFKRFIHELNINTVIDLRADRELEGNSYTVENLNMIKRVHAPFDPWNQSIEFQNVHHKGTNVEIAYKFFILECKASIKSAIEAIIMESNGIVIHCHAGKDRTGVFITILHMLAGADLDIVYNDYLASESDTRKEYIQIVIDIINEHGGAEAYLNSCGLSKTQVLALKEKIINS